MALSKDKKVLITGGTGFIGRNLQEYLKGKFNIFAPTHVELDLTDTLNVSKYISDHNIDVIINCAAYGIYGTEIQDIVSRNLRMFFNIVRNLDKVKRIIHFGSGAEYDKSRPIIRIKEEDFDQRIPKDGYGFYKYICSKYIEESDKIVCLRLFGVYGKYDNYKFKFISNAIVKNLLRQDIVINQNVVFDYLFIDDLMPIVEYFILNKPKFKNYNVSPDESIDLITISNIINEISDYKSKIVVLKRGLNNEYTGDNSRLKNEIPNVKITNYKEGIEKLFRYYKENLDRIDKDAITKDRYLKSLLNKNKL